MPTTNAVSTAGLLESDLRAKALAVLASLQAAKKECDAQLARLRRPDPMKQVTGKSSLDEAIRSTTRLISELDEAATSIAAKPTCEVEVRVTGNKWAPTACATA